eukprot:13357153-Heterocapsa_arctica.AAC.1
MLRIASAETDCRSQSLTPASFCHALILRMNSGPRLLAAKRSLQTRSIQSLAWNVQVGPCAAWDMIRATRSSGAGALRMNLARNRMWPSPLNVTVVHSRLAGRLVITIATMSSSAWFPLSRMSPVNACPLS